MFSIGTQAGQLVGPELMYDVDGLKALSARLPLPRPIRESHRQLTGRVNRLANGAQTALGPGLLLSVRLAGRVPGSRVVLLTDGCANVGLGRVDEQKPGLEGSAFYPFVGNLAKELGVVVNIVSFTGISRLLLSIQYQ